MAYSGYKVIVYMDVNPQSSTYQQQRTERVFDSGECPTGDGNWRLTSSYCELDEYNRQDGYLVRIYQNTDVYSPTFGETRKDRVLNTTTCPVSTETDPIWQIVEDNSHCEIEMIGNGLWIYTGRYIADLQDVNILSETFGNHVETAYTENTWPYQTEFPCEATDTSPDIEVITSACVLTVCDGELKTNGFKEITGIDKNRFSDTFLETVTTVVPDTVNCPDNCSPVTDVYVFHLNDPSSSTTFSQNLSSGSSQYQYPLTSTKNGSNTGYTVTSKPSWITATTTAATIFTMDVEENPSNTTRSGQLILTQTGSNNTITFNFTQSAGSPQHDYSQDYFKFITLEDGTFKFVGYNSMQYSLDSGSTWITLSDDTWTPTITSGNEIWWKSDLTGQTSGFRSTGRFNVEGNIMSLAYGDNFVGETTLNQSHCFMSLLYSTDVVNAENLVLPATGIDRAISLYESMFHGCTSLIKSPKLLPAQNVGYRGYRGMFYGCTSLTTVPEIAATTVDEYSLAEMFQNCTSLTTAPGVLSATTLAEGCYQLMFNGCTNLTTAPALPATTLTDYCYRLMFSGCSNLNSITCLATDISATNCTSNWVSGVSATGTFTKAASMTGWPTGTSGIPSGWTVQNA